MQILTWSRQSFPVEVRKGRPAKDFDIEKIAMGIDVKKERACDEDLVRDIVMDISARIASVSKR